jgi:Flp pilus assembly protein TadG
MKRSLTTLAGNRDGSVAIEFGIIAPAFLMMLLGVFQVGVWMQAYNAMRNAVAATARSVAVEYQTDNKLTDSQIANTGLAVATTNPYMLDPNLIEVDVDAASTQPFPGARELTLTFTYQMPSFLGFAGISGPSVSYSRSLFVSET